ncbi:unnamed protein product [Adineta steineri]|uniref:Hint domain-containing protein n=1 Tax=Adineta steineri TaxID=433720 RepID=A0A813WT49_9BILA|nr:unnamed protein product [Adineta steineri]
MGKLSFKIQPRCGKFSAKKNICLNDDNLFPSSSLMKEKQDKRRKVIFNKSRSSDKSGNIPPISASIIKPSRNNRISPRITRIRSISSIQLNSHDKDFKKSALSTLSIRPVSPFKDSKKSARSTLPIPPVSQFKYFEKGDSNKNRRKKRSKQRFILFLVPLLVVSLASVIGISLFAALHKSTTTTTTTTTRTTTTDTTTTTPACYFGDDYVNLVHGGQRRIGSLEAGDRIWTLSQDGQHLFEDEIMVIPHAGSNTLTYFYTFTTIEGHRISLTDSHYIFVVDNNDKKMKTICASKVTLEHQLVIPGRTIGLKEIIYSQRIGFYSPITVSGYLLVNNLSTSVYVDFFHATHEFHHAISGPARVYYRITKWLFGDDYKPLGIHVSEELHPISTFVITIYEQIQLFYLALPFIMLLMSIIFIIHLIHRFCYQTEYYQLKTLSYINKLQTYEK